jgi:hypothetical protein
MKDIDLCPGTNCPLASTCLRAIWYDEHDKNLPYRWEIDPPEKPCKLFIAREYYGG